MHRFLEVFIPLFVTIDPIGVIPLFLSITTGMPLKRKRSITFQAVGVSAIVMTGFILLGHQILTMLSLSPADFRIAGGIILLVLAVLDLVMYGKPAVHETEMVGLVPLAMPLIAGPGALTTSLVLANNPVYGHELTLLCLILNLLLLLGMLLLASQISRYISRNAMAAVSKLIMVLLAAIAVNFIRMGITEVIAGK